jgi:hypothetical protein
MEPVFLEPAAAKVGFLTACNRFPGKIELNDILAL